MIGVLVSIAQLIAKHVQTDWINVLAAGKNKLQIKLSFYLDNNVYLIAQRDSSLILQILGANLALILVNNVNTVQPSVLFVMQTIL